MGAVAIAAVLPRFAGMPRIGVHHRDHPVLSGLPGDPPPPICPVAAFRGLHVLPGDQRQQPCRGGRVLIQFTVAQHGEQRMRVVHQGRDQAILRLRVIPVDLRLTRPGVVVAGAQLRDLRCGSRHHPGHPADRGNQLGDGVLGRHRIRQDRGVHRPAAPALQHPGLRDYPRDRLIDPVRALRARQPPPPVHQSGGIEARVIQREPARRLPPQVTPGRLGRLGVGIVMQHLQDHDRGHHARRDRRPALPRREQVREILITEQVLPVRGQEREHAPRRHQTPDQRPSIQQLPVRTLFALHLEIISDDRTHCRQTCCCRPLYSGPS